MIKRRVKTYIGLFLLVFTAVGLTLSTLHSHHQLELHHQHPQEFADTGHCISSDTTPCTICGYIFKTNLPFDTSANSVFYSSKELEIENELHFHYTFEAVNKGRSPPVTG